MASLVRPVRLLESNAPARAAARCACGARGAVAARRQRSSVRRTTLDGRAPEEAARRRDSEATAKMAAFAEAAAKPGARPSSDNDFMKGLMSGLSATVEDPAAAASAAAAKAEAWMQAATAVVAGRAVARAATGAAYSQWARRSPLRCRKTRPACLPPLEQS